MRRISISWIAAVSLWICCLGCSPKATSTAPTAASGEPDVPSERIFGAGPGSSGPKIVLSEANTGEVKKAARVRPKTTALSDAVVDYIVARLPPMTNDDATQDVRSRESRPLPKNIETIPTVFPAEPNVLRFTSDDFAPRPESGELKVVHHEPTGKVSEAPHISVTFNKTMVKIANSEHLVTSDPPVSIDPSLEGTWRWAGPKTLVFEPAAELTRATTYTVRVAAGTKSVMGHTIAEPKTWTFRTPALKTRSSYPSGEVGTLRPTMFLEFDQVVSPQQLLEFVTVEAKGKTFAVELADRAALKDNALLERIGRAEPGTFMIIESVRPFPRDATVTVTLRAGAPSMLGPGVTEIDRGFTFTTFERFRVTDDQCGRGENLCRPGGELWFEFSSSLPSEDLESLISVRPRIPNMRIRNSRDSVSIYGDKVAREYKVTFSKKLTDKHGQRLEGKRTFKFKVGLSRPSASLPSGRMVVANPNDSPSFSVLSNNYDRLHVKLFHVEPKDWPSYERNQTVGTLITTKTIDIAKVRNRMVETVIDVRGALGGEPVGHVYAEVHASESWSREPEESARLLRTWVQVTRIGLDVFQDSDGITVWATDLKSGKPIRDVVVENAIESQATRSDKDGFAVLPPAKQSGGQEYTLATLGKDRAFVPWWRQRSYSGTESLAWYVFDDRGLYEPGETVSVKGWVRRIERWHGGSIGLRKDMKRLNWEVRCGRRDALAKGTTSLRGFGGFDFKFEVPDTAKLGECRLLVGEPGDRPRTSVLTFQVQEYRRPEFEVSATVEEGPHYAGDSAVVSLMSNYFSGGALSGSDVRWRVRQSESRFKPPNLPGFRFGVERSRRRNRTSKRTTKSETSTFDGHTDVSGAHSLRMAFPSYDQPRNITATATVHDVNRQAWSSSQTFVLHPSEFYVGIKTARNFVHSGKSFKVDVITANVDGELIPGRKVTVRAERMVWNRRKGVSESRDAQVCSVVTVEPGQRRAPEAATCWFQARGGGSYKIVASATDDKNRRSTTELSRWVSGGRRLATLDGEQKVELIPDKESYEPGDTAQILVRAPFAPAEGMVTYRRDGILEKHRFSMKTSTTVIDVPVKAEYLPNFFVNVLLVGEQARLSEKGRELNKVPKLPAHASETVELKVSRSERKLNIELKPHAFHVAPGAKTRIDLAIKDAKGEPVSNAEVALLVVDDAVLALTDYDLRDPLKTFYRRRSEGVNSTHSRGKQRSRFVLKSSFGRVGGLGKTGVATSSTSAKLSHRVGSKTRVARGARNNFEPLALFAPSVITDSNGAASVPYTMPDNLTRYRVIAVAVKDATHYGTAETHVTARLPLSVRPAPPRFLNLGDAFELPVVIQNQTAQDLSVHVVARGSNLKFGKRNKVGAAVNVPAFGRTEVRFPAAPESAGTARIQFSATGSGTSDFAEVSLPVLSPAREIEATYGVIDGIANKNAIAQPVRVPSNLSSKFGGVSVSVASTAMHSLLDAFLYLYNYEHACAEQISSRMLGSLAFRDVLSAFEVDGLPSQEEIENSMVQGIQELGRRQNLDGGFGFWSKRERSHPMVSLHSAHALVRADKKGYQVPKTTIRKVKNYVGTIHRRIPKSETDWTRRYLLAYALYIRKLAGDDVAFRARRLLAESDGPEGLPFAAVGWVLSALAGDADSTNEIGEIRRFLSDRVVETANTARFVEQRRKDYYRVMSSNRIPNATILQGMIDAQPDSKLIPKLANGLMAERKKGRWRNTQENTFATLALDKYFNTYESLLPDFSARAWIGNSYVGERKFKGRSADSEQIDIPMPAFSGSKNVVLQNDGIGRMYYRIAMSGVPKSLKSPAYSNGFSVEREYTGVDDPGDVTKRADGSWEIKAGSRVKVSVMIIAPDGGRHVAMVDPLPAGLEPLNPALAAVDNIPVDSSKTRRRWRGAWYIHQNMRDERVEAYTRYMRQGVHKYVYYARATTTGNFLASPTRVERMYNPEKFGNSGSDRVVVID